MKILKIISVILLGILLLVSIQICDNDDELLPFTKAIFLLSLIVPLIYIALN